MRLKNYRTSIIIALTFALLISAFWFFPSLAFICFISLLIHLLLYPLVNWLNRKMPRFAAAALILGFFTAMAVGWLGLVSSTFVPTFTKFITDFPDINEKIRNLAIIQNSDFLSSEVDNFLSTLMKSGLETLTSSFDMFLSFFNKFIDAVIILFVTFYLLKDGRDIENYIARLFPHQDYFRVYHLFERILQALRKYVTSQLTICCLTGIIVFSYFTLRGLPYASVFAVMSGVAEFIPVLGPTVASVLGTIMAVTQDSWLALQTAIFYLVLTQFNHNVIYPYLIGKSLNLHPIAIILGIILGGELLGAPGMFLAVPIIVICKLVIEDIYRDRLQVQSMIGESRWLRRDQS